MLNYNEIEGVVIDELKYTKLLKTKMVPVSNFPRLLGEELTLEYVNKSGLRQPLIIEKNEGLDMIMPDSSLTVRDVSNMCGPGKEVEVLEVSTQSGRLMILSDWASYYELVRFIHNLYSFMTKKSLMKIENDC